MELLYLLGNVHVTTNLYGSTSILMQQVHGGNTATSGLGDLFDNLVNHLSVAHHNFLKHWDRLIDLEARTSQVIFSFSNVLQNLFPPLNSIYEKFRSRKRKFYFLFITILGARVLRHPFTSLI